MSKRAVFIVALGFAAALPLTALAQATVTQFTGTEACQPIDPGTWTFPDGNIHIRGLILLCQETSTTPLFDGENMIVLNANLRADAGAFLGGVGPIWGTWQMGESWAGTWEGESTAAGVTYDAQGQGAGPNVGLKLWLTTSNGQFTGRILAPSSK